MKKLILIASLLMATSLWAEQKTCELIGGSDITIKACILEKENGNLKKKSLDLERENELDLDKFHMFVVDSCIATREEITTFGVYTLTTTTTDQDAQCIDDLRGYEAINYVGEFGRNGLSSSIASPEKVLVSSGYGFRTVKDIGEFIYVRDTTGGHWWGLRDVFLSKKAPYEIVFERYRKPIDEDIVWKDFDDDGHKEMGVELNHYLHWRGACTTCSTRPVIYLEYSSDSFKLDKDLTFAKANEKIKNTKPDRLKFYPDGSGYEFGWQGHNIPRTLIEIIAPLIVAGREEEAKKFLDDMWPDNLTDKELFWSLQKELVETGTNKTNQSPLSEFGWCLSEAGLVS